MAPIVPGISSHPRKLESTVRAVADHGAAFVGAVILHLEGGTRSHFLKFLQRDYPDLVGGYRRLYAGKYATTQYADRVKSVLGALKAKYGMTRAPAEPSAAPRALRTQSPYQPSLRGL